ncbi:MAG: RloB domain-containing protein [Alphaproteobacteria bacterium]|nr:RloB domain-containing protein [Alphaproteobacteria bacterium]
MLTPQRRVLIVSEGTETEPKYFEALRRHLRLTAAVVVKADCQSTPLAVVRYAIDIGGGYDDVYCLVDRDTHPLDQARIEAGKAGFRLLISDPCFELWFLLHFKFTTAPFSCCDELARALERYLPDYEKRGDNFPIIRSKTADALINAVRLRNQGDLTRTATEVDVLVRDLLEMRRKFCGRAEKTACGAVNHAATCMTCAHPSPPRRKGAGRSAG